MQLSAQSFDDYLFRTERYARSGVKVIWLVRPYESLSHGAVRYKGWRPGSGGTWPDLLQVPALPLKLRCPMDDPAEENIRVIVLRTDHPFYKLSELTLSEFVVGVARGRLTFMQRQRWMWRHGETGQ